MTSSCFPPVTIIIPNFNGAHLLKHNLPSVLDAIDAYPGGGSLVVVDDGSKDDSVALLERDFPQAQVVKHGMNQGFAEAIHSGVAAAQTEALFFLNSDVQPDRDFILPLIQALDLERGEVFSVSPVNYDESGRAHPMSLNCFTIRYGSLRRVAVAEFATHSLSSLYASGGSMLVGKSKFLQLGGFLPIFKPFYWEDFDLGVRACRMGWKNLLVPASKVTHQERGAIKESFTKREIKGALQRNKLLAEWIHFPATSVFLFSLPRLVMRTLAKTLVGDLRYWRTLAEAVAKLPEVLAIRRKIDADAKRSFREVLRRIEQENASRIEHAPQ